MSEKDHGDFNNSTKCCICKKAYQEGEVRVKDDDHVTRKYQGFLLQEGNLNLIPSKKSLLCFIICKTTIHVLSLKKLENKISK